MTATSARSTGSRSTASTSFAAIEQAVEGGATRIQLGEGPDAIVLAEADRRRWRQCGGCTLCCTVAGVNELKKPPMVACRHLAGKGCGIYASQPKACRRIRLRLAARQFRRALSPRQDRRLCRVFCDRGARRLCRRAVRQPETKPQAVAANWSAKIRAWVPEVRIIVDDKHGLIFHAGEPERRFRIVKRDPGDYETTVYMVEEILRNPERSSR